MMPIANRRNYGWFDIVCNASGKHLRSNGVSCSQAIKFTHSKQEQRIVNGYVQFYFPTDWMSRIVKNNALFKQWMDLVCTNFYNVDHLGSKKSSEIEMNFNSLSINQGFPSSMEGDIINDSWEVFRMEVKDHNEEKERRQYCAYCMIRYLFSDHYEQIPRTFYRIKNMCFSLGVKDITDFCIIQLSHYYFTGYTGFFETYSLIKVENSSKNVYWPRTIEEYNELIKNHDYTINAVFSGRGQSSLSILEFQKLLESNKIKEIYGKIK